ncbi:hypothetical protein ACTQ54_04795 [Fundicoccus sp. Sow4_H7]|uniref:hypothetical protein n=1 Tax=Fundicoccus sp. Sow4_H7 TaxID=3438784 RepID=UPI003F90A46A
MSREKKSNNTLKTAGIGILLIGLIGFGGNELGLFGQDGLFGSNNNGEETTNISSTEINDENAIETIHLTVNEDTIFWNDEVVDEETLINNIENTDENVQFTVTDQSAIKATYDTLINALTEHNREYTETHLR